MKLKDNIKTLRKRDNLTQLDLAKRIRVKQYNVSDYEIGRIEPSISVLARIADTFDVSVDYLIGRRARDDEEIKKDEKVIKSDKYIEKINDDLKNLSDDQKKMIVELVHFSVSNMLK